MKRILICPAERPPVAFLAQSGPLVNVSILGEPLICRWMEWHAANGIQDILVLATDRPEQVREAVADGERWGLRVQVKPELQELTPDEARARYPEHGGVAQLADHLPGMPEFPLFNNYGNWFTALTTWLHERPQFSPIGCRQIAPGVWVSKRAQISSTAQLIGPCWIGEHVKINAHAKIGPNAFIENRVVVESAVEISDSIVGPDTFVGALTRVQHSIAWGSTLIDWSTGSCAHVPDAFLMCPLSQRFPGPIGSTADSWSDVWQLLFWRTWQFLTGRKAKLRN